MKYIGKCSNDGYHKETARRLCTLGAQILANVIFQQAKKRKIWVE